MTTRDAIPRLPFDTVTALAARIKPVVLHEGRLHYITDVNPTNIAFTWDPTIRNEATGLTPLREIITLHPYNSPMLFKPTIAEVLAQIPADLLDTVVAFRTEADGDRVQTVVDGNNHRARTTLYTRSA